METYRKISVNDNYSVSDLGNVRNDKTGKILKPQDGGKGYMKVRLFNGSHSDYIHIAVHRLVAFAFPEICGEYSDGLQVDHLNTIRNDNRAINLRWTTPSQNRMNPITNEKFVESNSGEKHWMYGKKHSEESKMKMSESHKGKHYKYVDGVMVCY